MYYFIMAAISYQFCAGYIVWNKIKLHGATWAWKIFYCFLVLSVEFFLILLIVMYFFLKKCEYNTS